jgi:hypothetical protein
MEQNTLFFIPDISGFTKFITETEVSHSKHIISELLELIIDSNQLGLQVSEIEGDAIFFYRPGTVPYLADIAEQAKKMFIEFHSRLKMYEQYGICQCGACKTAHKLTLKIIAHYGQAQSYKVKDHDKLIGKDVIVVHRLLKNNVPENEYLLLTDSVLQNNSAEIKGWFRLEPGHDTYDEIGKVGYGYSTLTPLMQEVKVSPPEEISLSNPFKIYEQELEINAPMEDIYALLIDLEKKNKWQSGVKDVIIYDNKLNQVGTVHKCFTDHGNPDVITANVKITENSMEFWEVDAKKIFSSMYRLERITPDKTLIKFATFIKGSLILRLMVKLFMQKKLVRGFSESMSNLKKYCEETFNPEKVS